VTMGFKAKALLTKNRADVGAPFRRSKPGYTATVSRIHTNVFCNMEILPLIAARIRLAGGVFRASLTGLESS
jgi:hypothetical protein